MEQIRAAAVELVNTHGYANVTVTMLADAGDISPATFFNYFGSKEHVFLGPDIEEPSAQAMEQFIHSTGNIIEDFGTLVRDSIPPHTANPSTVKKLRRIVMETEELRTREMARIIRLEETLRTITVKRLALQDPEPTEVLKMRAKLVVEVSSLVVRRAHHLTWILGTGEEGYDEAFHRCVEEIHDLTDLSS